MRQHEKSWDFVSARIRIATLDKAHYSLIKDNPEFTVNLKCMVLDEAHQYDGIFGANVASFLKRVYVAKTSAGRSKPNMFLASATLADAKSFASKLLSIPEKDIYHQKDTNQSIIEPVKINDVQQILNEPTPNGLTRVVLFNDGMVNNSHIAQVVSDTSIIGEKLNLLYFLDSKFLSRVKKSEIEKKTPQRKVVIYDGDLTPQKRRQIESYFNGQQLTGATLIATSALEMGVDIENLDVCILHSLPPKRADILQRIGRVGRRQERPGLILVNLAKSPLDRYISETVDAIFRAENAMSVPIPANIEIINLKNIAAVQYEMWKNGSWCHGRYHGADWPTYKQSLRQYFGVDLNISEVKKKIKERYSSLIELNTGENWTHKGFRASVSGSKIPIKIYDTKDEIAWIDSINIFRDAHPEAVYLDDQDRCWRVVAYSGKWKEALWDHPESDAILAKYLKSIDVVYVKPERSNIVTRGIWEEKFKPYQILNEPPQATTFPKQGNFEYGIWEYYRRFNGYMQINRSTKSQTKVDLAEVSERFKSAINNGGEFPFLFPLTYRTYGWEWSFPDALQNYSPALLNSINSLVGAIIIPFIADAIQTKPNDLIIYLSLPTKKLMVLDATPGGNGLSEGLLRCQGIPAAFQKCLAMLIQFTGGNNREKFRDYIINFCQEDATHDAEDLIKIIHEIKNHWGG